MRPNQERSRADASAPVAAIDCGTNSIRLLIARPGTDGSPLEDLERRMDVVRLGQGVDRTGRLAPEAVDRTLAVIDEFARSINAHHVRRLRFVATSATRDASNRDLFIDGVRDRLGVAPEVISGTEEAELSFTGTVGTLPGPVPSPRLVVDIGGGSTELVLGEHHPTHRISLDVGSVRLTERFFASDPPSRAQREEAAAFVDDLLDAAEREVPLAQARTLVGVAGTVTTLTALYAGLTTYTPDVTHGLRVGIDEYRALCDRVLAMPRSERVDQPIIHPGRVDVIAAGALIWERVMTRVSAKSGVAEAVTAEHDILDGIALGLL